MALRRIGQVMIDLAAISDEQRDELLAEQKNRPDELFGKIAEQMGYITDEQLAQALVEQFNADRLSQRDGNSGQRAHRRAGATRSFTA